MYPWLDYGGRVSPLKTVVFALLFVPGAWIAGAYALGALGPRPLNEAIHQCGLWTVRFLLLSLAVTPARQALQWSRLVLVRRMIGVAAFCYISIHLLLYIADQSFDLGKVATEIVLRFYLTIGFFALLGLAALASTSTDGMMRRLGGKGWQRLHRAVYVIGVLGLTHYFLQSKLEVYEPTYIAGFFLWLMGYRIIAWRRRDRRVPLWAIALLGVAASAATAIGEAVYFWATIGVSPVLILSADFMMVRPAWIVLAASAAVTGLVAGRSLLRPESKLRLRPA
jgi:sulfoxide reductase heme-binding subunit YedZ